MNLRLRKCILKQSLIWLAIPDDDLRNWEEVEVVNTEDLSDTESAQATMVRHNANASQEVKVGSAGDSSSDHVYRSTTSESSVGQTFSDLSTTAVRGSPPRV